MKKTYLKRKGSNPIRKLKEKVDRALQDYYRKTPHKCLLCKNKAELMHHFVLKSMSNRLRYEDINLIPLCGKCHQRAHFGSENIVGAEIGAIKGQEWLKKIQKLRNEHISLTVKLLNEKLKDYV